MTNKNRRRHIAALALEQSERRNKQMEELIELVDSAKQLNTK